MLLSVAANNGSGKEGVNRDVFTNKGDSMTDESKQNTGDTLLQMMRALPSWEAAISSTSQKIATPEMKQKVREIQHLYVGARGPMVVDVVASRRRRYETHVAGRIIPDYIANAEDQSLKALAGFGPRGVTLWSGEALTMVKVAEFLMTFSVDSDDEKTIANFAENSAHEETKFRAMQIRGIGPVLYEYLRLLSGVDTLKADSRVRESLGSLGIPAASFSDEGILEICRALAKECGCSLVELDQALWNR